MTYSVAAPAETRLQHHPTTVYLFPPVPKHLCCHPITSP